MDWQQFNHVALHRLWQSIREHSQTLTDADAWLAKYGRPPADPLRIEVQSALRHLDDLADIVRKTAETFGPYRPLMDPWQTRGLSAVLRPDFQIRGIDEERP